MQQLWRGSLPGYDWNNPDGEQRLAKKVSYYYDRIKVVGLQYRAQFHFADNGSGSLYMGSTVGLRYIRQTIAEESYGSRPTGYYEQAKKVVVPVGVRLDFRGGLDDAYGDVYLGAQLRAWRQQGLKQCAIPDRRERTLRPHVPDRMCVRPRELSRPGNTLEKGPNVTKPRPPWGEGAPLPVAFSLQAGRTLSCSNGIR